MFKLFKKEKPLQSQFYCIRYKVKGINLETGRRKTAHLIVGSWEDLEYALPRCGLSGPYEYKKEDRLPTERQIQYARSVNISFPSNSTLEDISVLISRYEDDIQLNLPLAPACFFEYAVKNDVFLPSLVSEKEAREWLLCALPNNASEIQKLNK